jgi:hypothetical protein
MFAARDKSMSALRRGAFFLVCSAAFCIAGSGFAAGQAPEEKQAAQNYLWARLANVVDISVLRPGSLVTARVDDSWSTEHCFVQLGTTLKGKVSAVEPASDGKGMSISIGFTVACTEGVVAPVTLIAVLYPKEDASRDQMQTFMSMPAGLGAGASGRQSTDLSRMPSPGSDAPRQPKVKVGQVSGVRHLALRWVAAAPGRSVLSVSDKRLRLEQGTRMAFRLAGEGQ